MVLPLASRWDIGISRKNLGRNHSVNYNLGVYNYAGQTASSRSSKLGKQEGKSFRAGRWPNQRRGPSLAPVISKAVDIQAAKSIEDHYIIGEYVYIKQ